MSLAFEHPPAFTVPIFGEETEFPVRRIFCVVRNYENHAAVIGG